MCYYNGFNIPAPQADEISYKDLPPDIEILSKAFSGCGDFEKRKINIGLENKIYIHICWIDGIVSGGDVGEDVLRPLSLSRKAANAPDEHSCIEYIMEGSVYSYSVKKRDKATDVISDLTHGHCALIFQQEKCALTFEVRSDKTRGISEPTLEKSIKGAKDSFIETLRVNTALVRRRICTPRLKLAQSNVGRKSHTTVAIMFVEGIANPQLVEETCRRLDLLDIDALLATGSLEEYIVDHPLSPFPQLIHTERPDRFAMYLMDGRVGILIDGLPVGLVLPVNFAEFMKVTSDSNMHFMITTSLNFLRYFALILSLFLPALYVAVAMYHQEMIPTRLLISIITAKQDVPFSTAIEVFGMIVAFGLLQEAGLRLPNPIGDTVSIIGALIVGQSAVEARVVSPIAIIVVAVSGIACYTLPSQDMGSAVRLLQLGLLIAAIAGGLFGVTIATCLIILLLASMDSFGVNYTAPLSEGKPWGLIRLLINIPKPKNKFRDPLLKTPDKRRQK